MQPGVAKPQAERRGKEPQAPVSPETTQRKLIYGEGALKAPVPHELMGSVRSPNK